MKKVIVNIHGFGGQGQNTKYEWLVSRYPGDEIRWRTFDYTRTSPFEILDHYRGEVEAALKAGRSPGIVATSWGGFFGYCLNALYPEVPAVLVNPALNPHLVRRKLEGEVEKALALEYVELFGKYMLRHSDKTCLVILGKKDALIPHGEVTEPLFAEESIRWFDLGHDFILAQEREVQKVIEEHFARWRS